MEIVRHLKRYSRILSRTLDHALLPGRYAFRKMTESKDSLENRVLPLEDIPIYVINLATRSDRLRETRAEFRRIGLTKWARFDAQENENGALGCSLSHASLLDQVAGPESVVMVCEDDLEFLASGKELTQILEDFQANSALDVLCLAFNLGSKPFPINSRLALTANSATTACYVAKARAIPLLKKSFLESANLIAEDKPLGLVAADQHWKRLQRAKLIFAVPRNRVARQRDSYSDIERREVSYGV